MNFKCPFCNQMFEKPGYHQHGKAMVALKEIKVVPGSYFIDTRKKTVYGGAKSDD